MALRPAVGESPLFGFRRKKSGVNGLRVEADPLLKRNKVPVVIVLFVAIKLGTCALDAPSEAQSYYQQGLNYFQGLSKTPKDEALALGYFRTAAAAGYAPAQNALGVAYVSGRGVQQDKTQAAIWYRKAADQGNDVAQLNLGACYASGIGVPQDQAQAVFWYRKASEKGNANAQTALAGSYQHGDGVAQDAEQAAFWYRKAADQGSSVAQNNLGNLYAKGLGVPKDEVQAASWYQKAANQGQATAQNNLGWVYENGIGVTKDEAQAAAWYKKSAEQGNVEAESQLARLFRFGIGVPKDETQATIWSKIAAEQTEPTKVSAAYTKLAPDFSVRKPCVEPIAPDLILPGSLTATPDQMLTAHLNVQAYNAATASYRKCLDSAANLRPFNWDDHRGDGPSFKPSALR
jgi:TPR repeat protein